MSNNVITAEVLAARLSGIETMLARYFGENPRQNAVHVYLTVAEAADLLCKSIHTVYGMVSRREIPHLKKGNRLYFREDQLVYWLEAGKRETIHEVLATKSHTL